jgi:hypothetical protein
MAGYSYCAGALACLLLPAVAFRASAVQSSAELSAAEIDRRVVSSLPAFNGESANVVAHLDLTRPFNLRSTWTFVAAVLPGTHVDGSSEDPVKGGPLARCFVQALRPHCTYTNRTASSNLDYSIPIELYSAEVVFRGANSTRPLLMVQTGGSHGGDGGHSIFTELFDYDRQSGEFKFVFSNATGSNNNQRTRFVDHGPLRGDVIVDEPSGCCYRIKVYRQGASGRYASGSDRVSIVFRLSPVIWTRQRRTCWTPHP